MPVIVENAQTKIPIETKGIELEAVRMLKLLGYEDLLISIKLTDNKEIQELNKTFRKKDKPTDILSFPFYPNLQAGECLELGPNDEPELGDIAISVEYAEKDAGKLGIPVEQHLTRLLAHGITHLLGYDHNTDEEFEAMQKVEAKLLLSRII